MSAVEGGSFHCLVSVADDSSSSSKSLLYVTFRHKRSFLQMMAQY